MRRRKRVARGLTKFIFGPQAANKHKKMNTEKREIKKLKANALADFITEHTAKWVTQEEAENEGRPLDYSFGPYDILMSELQEQAKNGHNFF